MLTIEDLFNALHEACKVQIAVNYARLVVETHDEDGNELSDETVQEEMTVLFNDQMNEFDLTMEAILGRIIALKQEAAGGLQVVTDPATISEAHRGKEA